MFEHPKFRPWVDGVMFEQLLSAKPQIGSLLSGKEPCLRDLILHYYETAGGGICASKADGLTKEYIRQLWEITNA